jgi:hypothetical protein
MPNKNKKVIDPIPDEFESEEAAATFWDSHSTMDYAEYLTPVEDVFEIETRLFEVTIKEDIFQRLLQEAQAAHKPVPLLVDQILRKSLVPA